MATILSEELRKVVMAGIGATALTVEKSTELVEQLVERGEMTVEQGKVINEELKHNIKKSFSGENDTSTLDQLDTMSDEELKAIELKLAEVNEARKAEKNGGKQK
jgi:polyhydroxyalkanoate synthesis regulator phasin